MERIHVAVRTRPLPPEESHASPWRISGNAIALIPQPSSKFEFDRIFGEDCRTVDVYEARTKDIVASSVRGFNGTVFAYGQTNSGKTYTMRGSAEELGLIPLAVNDLFRSIEQHVEREFLLRMSYMEIYNEEINDLLAPEHRKLQIHESLERGIYVTGLREEIVTCPEQVLDFVEFGESHRHIGETNMNLYSSRSHTIFRMIVESREKVEDDEMGDSCDAVRVSVLNLVDLAGSERAAKTGAEGMRLKEGSHINKSLMTLGTVIKKLSEGVDRGGHVPYRDSKLTRILQPALGGNANTAIICNITLAQIHADETKSTLQFASRALRVTNCVCVNEILTDAALLKRQKKEIEELRAKLMDSQAEHWEEEILSLRNTLLQSELEKERIALELEEERKAKEHRDRRLIEQAKKIENLSSLVLCSERDDRTAVSSKNKRRVTWCPVPSSRHLDAELQQSTLSALEQARIANEKLSLMTTVGEFKKEPSGNPFISISEEIRGVVFQVDQSRYLVDEVMSFVEQLLQGFSMLTENFMELKSVASSFSQFNSIIREYEKKRTCLTERISKVEMHKTILHDQSFGQHELQKINCNLENCEKAMAERTLQYELEKDGILCQLLSLQKEVSALSSSSLMKEKESLRKELEKTKTKLRETESRFKNSIQDKVKLESEKAQAEREIKKLHGQRALLERDKRKRDCLIVDKRHESKLVDHGKPTDIVGTADQSFMDEYQKLEVYASEMEAKVASLQEALISTIGEKEEAFARIELLNLQLEESENKKNAADLEIQSCQEEIAIMAQRLVASECCVKNLESSLNSLSREKEEMGMQVADVLLEMEAEKSMWRAKEKDFVKGNENLNISNNEIHKLSEDLIQVRDELESCREQCRILQEKLIVSNVSNGTEKISCMGKSSELRTNANGTTANNAEYEKDLQSQLLVTERHGLLAANEQMQISISEAEILKENYSTKLIQAKSVIEALESRIASFELKIHNDTLFHNKEKTKLRMQACSMQVSLDAHRGRHEESINEMKLMHDKFKEASEKFKTDLSTYGSQILNLKKQLKDVEAQCTCKSLV